VLGFGYVCSTIACIGKCLYKLFSKCWQTECRTHLPWRARWIWTVLTFPPRPLFRRICYSYSMCVRAIRILDAWKVLMLPRRSSTHLKKSCKLLVWLLPPTSLLFITLPSVYQSISQSMGRNSSVGIALSMGLTVWDRIPVDAKFSATGLTGSGADLAFCTMIMGYFLRIKRPGLGFY